MKRIPPSPAVAALWAATSFLFSQPALSWQEPTPNQLAESRELNLKGCDLGWKREYRRSIDVFTRAIELDPKNSDAFANRGLSLWYIGESEKALRDFDKALELNPLHSLALSHRGKHLLQHGKAERAVMDFKKVVSLSPKRPEAHLHLAVGYLHLGRPDLAGTSVKKGLSLDADNLNLLFLGIEIHLDHPKKSSIGASEANKLAIRYCRLTPKDDEDDPKDEDERLYSYYALRFWRDSRQLDIAIAWQKKALELADSDLEREVREEWLKEMEAERDRAVREPLGASEE